MLLFQLLLSFCKFFLEALDLIVRSYAQCVVLLLCLLILLLHSNEFFKHIFCVDSIFKYFNVPLNKLKLLLKLLDSLFVYLVQISQMVNFLLILQFSVLFFLFGVGYLSGKGHLVKFSVLFQLWHNRFIDAKSVWLLQLELNFICCEPGCILGLNESQLILDTLQSPKF